MRTDRRPHPSFINPLVAVLFLACPLLILLLAAGCTGSRGAAGGTAPGAKPSLTARMAQAQFVGDASCAECHAEISAKQALTSHQKTLIPMDRDDLGSLAPPYGRVPGSDILLLKEANGRYALGVAGEKDQSIPLHFAIGSGKTGMTHVAVLEDNTLLELGRSYFPREKKWYVTPGHEKHASDQVGMVYDQNQARQCFSCHAVTVPIAGIAPSPLFFGVGCEACHGPASVHVEVAQAKEDVRGTLEKLGAWKPSRLNELCGKCHRSQQSVQMNTSQAEATNRFQSYGLMKSKCFKESGGQISCVTCHDPHENTSRNPNDYETACLKCHLGGSASPAAVAASQTHGKACPVNPRGGCIPCHMPSRPVFKNSPVPTQMADHFIRVHEKLR